MKNTKFALMAILGIALAFTFSCSSVDDILGNDSSSSTSPNGGEQSYNYCITAAGCLPGPFTASTCTGQLSNGCPNGSSPSAGSSSSVKSGGGSSSSGGSVTPANSLDGIWEAGAFKMTISGNAGVYSAFGTFGASNAVWNDAISKGYINVGDQCWRNITSTGNLTWSGQEKSVQYYTSNPNVATGTNWFNQTFTLSADGQTLTVGGNIFTRSSHSLDGVWENKGGSRVTVSGSTGVSSAIGTVSALGQSAIDKGYWTLNTTEWRNLTSTGNLTWSGQALQINYNKSNPNVATGTSWANSTFTLSADGQTLSVTAAYLDGTSTSTYTRKQ